MKHFFYGFLFLTFIQSYQVEAKKKGLTQLKKNLSTSFKNFSTDRGKKALPLVKEWLKNKRDPNFRPIGEQRTMLFIAAYYGHEEMCRILLQAKANPKMAMRDGTTPLHVAALHGHYAIVSMLMKKIDINRQNRKGSSALNLAAKKGHIKAVEAFLKHPNIKINEPNRYTKETALSHAVKTGNRMLVELLLKSGANPNTLNHLGESPLYIAADYGYDAIVRLLLDAHAKTELTKPGGITPYAIAFSHHSNENYSDNKKNYKVILESLSSHRADTTKRTSMIIGTMNKLGYRVNEKGLCYGIAFMAMQALLRNDFKTFKKRFVKLQKGKLQEMVQSILHKRSLQESHIYSVTGEVNYKLNQSEIDLLAFFDGISLYYNISNSIPNYYRNQSWKREYIAFNLSRKQKSKAAQRRHKRKPLGESFDLKNLTVKAGIVLDNQQSLEKMLEWLRSQRNPLSIVLHNLGHTVALIRDELGKIYLVNHDILKELKANPRGATILKNSIAYDGIVFAEIVYRKSYQMRTKLEFLLNDRQDFVSPSIKVFSADKKRQVLGKALFYFARDGYNAQVRALLSSQRSNEVKKIVNFRGVNASTALMEASLGGYERTVLELLKHDVSINTFDEYRNSALKDAAAEGHDRVVKALLDNRANVNIKNTKGWAPLHFSANAGHIRTTQILLKKGAAVNLKTAEQQTPLHYASSQGHVSVMKLLLAKGARTDVKNQRGFTPLHFAAEYGFVEAIKLLLKHGAKINQTTNDGDTAVSLAAQWGFLEAVKTLTEAGADIGKDEIDSLPLDQAMNYNYQDIANYLASKLRR